MSILEIKQLKRFFIWHLDNRNKKGHPHLTNDFDSACRFEGKNFDPAVGIWILNDLTFRVQNQTSESELKP